MDEIRKEACHSALELVDAARGLFERAQDAGRSMDADEVRQFDDLMDRAGVCEDYANTKGVIDELNKKMSEPMSRKSTPEISGPGRRYSANPMGKDGWRTADGKAVRVYRNNEPMADRTTLPDGIRPDEVSFGRYLRGLITGDWSHAQAEQALMRASSTGVNASAGWLVPTYLSSQFIDLARAKSTVIKAGARTIELAGNDLSIARLKTDPTVALHAENETITDSDPVFDRVLLTPRTIAVLCKVSRELMEDAVNGDSVFEQVLSNALANKLDYYCLTGTGGDEIQGIVNYSNVNTITSVGSPLWSDVLNAVKLIRIDNQEPNAYVISPTTLYSLQTIMEGDGTNSPLAYQVPPPGASALTEFVTSQIADANAVVGDFTQAMIGMRQQILLEASPVAGDAFEKHQVFLKGTIRADFAIADPEAMCVLSGIS